MFVQKQLQVLCTFVLDEVAEVGVLLLADRRLKRHGFLRDLHDLVDACNADAHLLCDLLGDEAAPAPAEAASFMLLREQLEEVLETLTDREKNVLRLRFGLEDGRSRTLEEVGQSFGVTRERIRQIESKTMSKLRHPSRSQVLRDYLD